MSVVPSVSATEDFTFDRVAGNDRFVTSTLVAEEYEGGDLAILVNGQNGSYADALSANYLAGVLDAPILLTRAGSTPSAVLSHLSGADVTTVVVVGGETVVSARQVEDLEDAGFDVTRIAGTNRYNTSASVIAAGGESVDGLGLVATGQGFADALAGGPLAYQGHPLALSRQDQIDAPVIAALKDAGVNSVYVLGGPNVISNGVLAQLEAEGITVLDRLSGKDRAATSVAVANKLISDHGFSADAVNVASGASAFFGADALSGGPLTGLMNQALLVTNNANNPASVTTFLGDSCATISSGLIFGGHVALSEAAQREMETAARSCDAGDETVPVLSGAAATVEGRTIAASVTATDDVEVAGVSAVLLDEAGTQVSSVDATASGDVYAATFTEVADGSYAVRFTATDTSGNTAEVTTGTVEVAEDDVTDPVLSGAAATVEGRTIAASVTATDDVEVAGVTAVLRDEEGTQVASADATATGDVYAATFAEVDNGTYTVRFTATDTSGNTAQATTGTVEVVDETAPVLSGAGAAVEGRTIAATVTAIDDAEVAGVTAVLLDEEGGQISSVDATASGDIYTATFNEVDNGTYTVRFTATDTSGNTTQATTGTVEVDVDETAPILSGAEAAVEGRTIAATVTATDDVEVAGVTAVLLDEEGDQISSADATASGDIYTATFTGVADGTYTVRFTATDTSGNTTQAITAAVEVDSTLKIGEPYVADDGLTVTLNSLTVTEKPGSFQYTINYTLLNETSGAIDEGSWKAYDLEGRTGLAQYGFFGRLFPGDTKTRSYTFEKEKAVVFDVVAYHSEQFFATVPPSDALVWRVPTGN